MRVFLVIICAWLDTRLDLASLKIFSMMHPSFNGEPCFNPIGSYRLFLARQGEADPWTHKQCRGHETCSTTHNEGLTSEALFYALCSAKAEEIFNFISCNVLLGRPGLKKPPLLETYKDERVQVIHNTSKNHTKSITCQTIEISF